MGVKCSSPGTQTRPSFAWDARTSWARCPRWIFKTLEITFLARLTLIIFLQMNQHLKLAHPKDGETNPVESPCGECGKNFQSKSALKFHIDTQHNNYISFAFWKYKVLLNPFWYTWGFHSSPSLLGGSPFSSIRCFWKAGKTFSFLVVFLCFLFFPFSAC